MFPPAYDLTGFHFSEGDEAQDRWQNQHALSVNGKFSGITDEDVLAVGEKYAIGTAHRVLAEVLDGQQRITSFGRFVRGKFPVTDADGVPKWFDGLGAERQSRLLDTPLTVYVCEGEREEIREWFKTINIAGVPLVQQELLNAIYSGPFVTAAKAVFSNCPLCAVGHEANATRVWTFDEMDADHVTAWSKGGATDAANCQMLCKTHNRAKGNR